MDPHALALAYGLSTLAGLRASYVLLAVAIALRTHVVALPAALAWLGSDIAIALLVLAALAEFFSDKIPALDNLLHAVHAVLAPAAGAVAASTAGPDLGPWSDLLIALGAGNALAVLGVRAGTRAGSTATTLGAANPFLSVIEDVLAVGGIALAFLAPAALAVVALIATLVAFRFVRATIRRRGRLRA